MSRQTKIETKPTTVSDVQMVAVKDIHVKNNSRKVFPAAEGEKMKASIKRHGIIQPLVLRPIEHGYELIAGERRFRAAIALGYEIVPARIRPMTDDEAEEQRLAENLMRLQLTPLEEAEAYERLLKGRPTTEAVRDVATMACQPVAHVYRMLTLTRLTPQIRDLLARDILPLRYALKLARVASQDQATALDLCFLPLHDGDRYQLQNLKSLRDLDSWLDKHVRLNPRSDDATWLFPEVVKQVQQTEAQKKTRLLQLSTLHLHTDRTEPRPILAQGWKAIDPAKPCAHARDGLIVLGEGRGDVVLVCAAKKECLKHWPRPVKTAESTDQRLIHERQRLEAEEAKRLQELWKAEGKPQALAEIAQKAQRMTLTPDVAQWLIEELTDNKKDIEKILGIALTKLPRHRCTQALLVTLAVRHAWSFDRLVPVAKRLNITLSPPRLKGQAA